MILSHSFVWVIRFFVNLQTDPSHCNCIFSLYIYNLLVLVYSKVCVRKCGKFSKFKMFQKFLSEKIVSVVLRPWGLTRRKNNSGGVWVEWIQFVWVFFFSIKNKEWKKVLSESGRESRVFRIFFKKWKHNGWMWCVCDLRGL